MRNWLLAGLPVFVSIIAIRYFMYSGSQSNVAKPQLSPVKAQEKLKKHSKTFDTPRVEKVTDGVYVAIGYALANMIMIEGKFYDNKQL